jgi:hypothetical protein
MRITRHQFARSTIRILTATASMSFVALSLTIAAASAGTARVSMIPSIAVEWPRRAPKRSRIRQSRI